MIVPCIDLMDGKVVQLVQGREKALEGAPPLEMLERFRGFPVIQVIDLDAALGRGSNDAIVELLASRARIRVGGGVRTPERARALVDCGAEKVIVGTSAFTQTGVNRDLLGAIAAEVGPERVLVALDSKGGRIVVKGWTEALSISAEEILAELEPYCGGYLCTYVDKEGMLQGTDLDWFWRLRAATKKELTAAGGITTLDEVRELLALDIHAALGMAIYTGRLDLEALRRINAEPLPDVSNDAVRLRPPVHFGSVGGREEKPTRFGEVRARLFDRAALAGDVELRAEREIDITLPLDQRSQTTERGHGPIVLPTRNREFRSRKPAWPVHPATAEPTRHGL